ncbi:MAG: flavodoxin-dependent (E)-4-hydroxy-3-methylbut-2-enyl-diphosphate synthase [Dehalococcoidia bacterium]|nr:flavodoxin-dependent (E)-4-hydroxy-3-methylbut-2-enyl-diphosphate synthase [Dehalococcoidia bacterium]MDD5493648.1 flavodoxin-dependent (E)-4-hydroxy-3-methylbut-2-enyl-diphosphate synthase [Dehalococcoidia bacterium]
MIKRRVSRPVRIGTVTVGGDAPVSVQSMTKTDTRNIKATVDQIKELTDCGCEIIRVAIPDLEAADAIQSIKKGISIPLIADIHFDHRLALQALKKGADGLRLNPGNIRDKEHIKKVVLAAKTRQIPIRIGVNFGSLPPGASSELPITEHMVNIAMEQVKLLESLDFDLIKIALKAFDVPTTIEAYRLIADRMPYPLHLGITESGLPQTGIIRSAVGIGILLHDGIGDTLRVSLSAHPREEVAAGFEILKSLNIREHGPVLVSCPSCGRTEADIIALAETVSAYLRRVKKPIKVAVMGCVVNGPGEARDADVGIACGKGRGVLFKKGEVVRTVEEHEFLEAIIREIQDIMDSA